MSYERRTALGTMVTARGLLEMHDPIAALYWAFIAGLQAAGRDYLDAKREAAALGLVPPCLQDAPTTAAETAE